MQPMALTRRFGSTLHPASRCCYLKQSLTAAQVLSSTLAFSFLCCVNRTAHTKLTVFTVVVGVHVTLLQWHSRCCINVQGGYLRANSLYDRQP